MVLRLALASACLVGAPAYAAEQALAAGATRAEALRRRGLRRAAGNGIEKRVLLLTRRLDLDAKQQAELRKLLVSQREQIRRVWADDSMSGADHIGATRAISGRTADRIRAMLNEVQRKKYTAPQRDAENPARPDVEHGMRLTRPGAGRAEGPAK